MGSGEPGTVGRIRSGRGRSFVGVVGESKSDPTLFRQTVAPGGSRRVVSVGGGPCEYPVSYPSSSVRWARSRETGVRPWSTGTGGEGRVSVRSLGVDPGGPLSTCRQPSCRPWCRVARVTHSVSDRTLTYEGSVYWGSILPNVYKVVPFPFLRVEFVFEILPESVFYPFVLSDTEVPLQSRPSRLGLRLTHTCSTSRGAPDLHLLCRLSCPESVCHESRPLSFRVSDSETFRTTP